MIELERHIEILLLNNDCVIVPNLGGFVAHHVDANYDDSDQLFLPPSRTLGFNPKLLLNDSLLAQSYIEAYDISYPDAMNRIAEEVNELKQEIENEGSYELNDIGVLSLNEDGHYEFMPCEAGILTPSLYGLSSFDMASMEEPEATVVDMTDATAGTAAALIGQETTGEDVDERTITIRISAIKNAVAIAAAIIALFLITTPFGKDSGGFNMSNIENGVLTRVMPKEMTSTSTNVRLQPVTKETKVETTVKPSTAKVQEPQQDVKPAVPQHYWSIVLASKVSMKNARAFVELLTNEGHGLAEVLVQKSGNRVIYGKYTTEKEAYAALGQLRNQEHFREAWVYEVKK
jgi:hypothetical protein